MIGFHRNTHLKTTSTPATGTFTVTVGTTARTVSNVSIAAKTVTLTLASAVIDTDTVTVGYTKPGSGNTLQGTNDAEVATFSGETVTNNTADARSPEFQSAAVNADALTVTFDEALDTGSTPAGSTFTVTATDAGGTARTIAGKDTVSIATATPSVATVTLASAVTAADTVQVRYAKPASNPLQDANSNHVATFGNQAVTNATAPVFSSATVNGATLTVTFDVNLDTNSPVSVLDFPVTVGGDPASVSSVSLSGKTVNLGLLSAVTAADTVQVRYVEPAGGGLRGTNGTNVAGFADQSVTNATAPAFSSAVVNGATLAMTFDVDLDTGSTPAPGDFFVTVGGTRRHVAAGGVALSGKTVTLTLASQVTNAEVVQVRYTQPGSNPLKGSANQTEVATFGNQAVSNVTGPVFESAAVNGDALTVTFDVALDPNSVPVAGAFTVTVTPAGGSGVTRTVDSVAVDADTVTLTLGSAVTDTDTVQVRYTKPGSGNSLKASANSAEVATFADQAVVNHTDSTRPTFQSAAVNADALTVTFSEDLDTGSVPAPGAFTVTVAPSGGASVTRTVDRVAIDADTVTLTLASAVTKDDTVQVRYTQPASNPLEDASGNRVATFADQSVTNATVPKFKSAAVNKDALTVMFSEDLDTGSVPAPGDFAVTVGGVARTVDRVAIDGDTVTLTLASAVTEGETVAVAYTKPASNPLKDTDGNQVETFSAQTVQNNTDSSPPEFQRAVVNKKALRLDFDEALDESSVPAPGAFTVTALDLESVLRTVAASAVDLDDVRVILTLATAVTDTDVVRLRYDTPASNPLQDAAGNPVVTFVGDETAENVTADEVAPRFTRAEIDGATLTLDFDEALDASSVPAPSAFVVAVEGRRRTVATGGVAIVAATRVGLTLSSAVSAAEVVTVRYSRPSSDPLKDGAGNRVASFANHRVANLTTDGTAPGFQSASINGVVLTLNFDESLDAGSLPVPGDFTVTVGGAPRALVADQLQTGGRRSVAIVGSTVVLRLVSPVTDTAVVTVRYTQPGSNALKDGAGNAVVSFANRTVRNDTSAQTVFVSATVNAGELDVLFSRLIPGNPEGDPFRANVSGSVQTASVWASGKFVEMRLDPPVTHRDTVTISYIPALGRTPLLDAAGNAVPSFSNKPVENLTPDESPPVLRGATVRGTTLTLTLDEALDANGLPPPASAFTVAGAETPTTVVAVAFHPSDDTRLVLTLSQAVASGPGVTVSYTKPASNPLRDPAGNEMADFANESLRAPPAPPPPPPPPPPPTLHTAPSFVDGSTVRFFIAPDHADGAPVGTVAATDADGDALVYSLAGDDSAFFTIDATGIIAVAPGTTLADEGRGLFTVTAQVSDGEDENGNSEPTPAIDDTIEVIITLADVTVHRVPLVPPASDAHRRQGFVRVVNHSGEAGEVSIVAIDDDGKRYGPVVLALDAHRAAHFNSDDLERGNPRKGFEEGTGPGEGNWRLVLESALDLEVLSYIRTDDGFVTSMHDVAPKGEAGHRVVFFNPASNRDQVSWLRLVNPGEAAVDITIEGIDDAGEAGESPVVLTLAAGASRMLSAQALEFGGEGLDGALGDGTGKWRLEVSAPQPIRMVSLLSSPTGHLTNLSATSREAAPGDAAVSHRVPLVLSASDPHRRQGFVRAVNHSGEAGEVSIEAIDDDGMRYGPVVLALDAHRAVHFNSDDLERGNARKGFEDGIGPGEGSWRLVLESALDLEVLSYVRTGDGFVTSVHDVAPEGEAEHRVVFFNPASNRRQVSWLRLINPGEEPVAVRVEGTDDAGEAGEGVVALTLEAGASRALSARALESGEGDGLVGALGDGAGKWRLRVTADRPIRVMSLLSSPTGHLTNLSAAPERP